MIPELGHFALLLALPLAVLLGALPLLGAWRGQRSWMAVARPAALALFLAVALSFACLARSFLVDDFTVAYVAAHSNTQLPAAYKFAAVWGGHEGSFLLWLLMLAGWTLAVAGLSRSLPLEMVARVLGVLGTLAAGFLVFVIGTSNPFARLLPGAAEGQDLNPLLQDPGLVIHPPMLYMGYVGFSVAFAFAIAALLAGRLDAAWARWSRPWTVAAWATLTLGIALGSHWAYYVLGWGGWWFWDPVENASFMPWLVGTALLHSLAVTEKRGSFRNWTVLLAILTFSLSLLGTFLVRSGVLTSVHAFANDPRRGVMILALLSVVIVTSLTIFAVRAPASGGGGRFGMLSRETLLLANNVLLVVAAACVLLGTLYPLALDALGLDKISVGPPYFNSVFVPIVVPAILLAALGPAAAWKNAQWQALARHIRLPAVLACVAAAGLPFALGQWTPGSALGAFCATWLGAATVQQVAKRLRSGNPPASYWGMHLAHLGLAVTVLGVGMVKNHETERDVRMAVGDTTHVGGYAFRLVGVRQVPGPNYTAMQGEITIEQDGQVLRTLHPQKRRYFSSDNPMTETAIDTGLFRDLYVSLGEPLDDGAWAVRVYYKPFVDWIWAGALLMMAGGMLTLADRRYRGFAQSARPDLQEVPA